MSENIQKARALLAEVAANGFAEGSALELLAALCDEADALRAERDEMEPLLNEIREFARMKSSGPAVYDDLWAVKDMADAFIMRNAPLPGAIIVEGAA